MEFLSSLFGTAGNVYQGYTSQKTAEANANAAKKKAAAQNNLTATIQKYAPWAIGVLVLVLGISIFSRSK